MKVKYLKADIRLALADLGENPNRNLPTDKVALSALLDDLQVRQAKSHDSKMSEPMRRSVLRSAAKRDEKNVRA